MVRPPQARVLIVKAAVLMGANLTVSASTSSSDNTANCSCSKAQNLDPKPDLDPPPRITLYYTILYPKHPLFRTIRAPSKGNNWQQPSSKAAGKVELPAALGGEAVRANVGT